MLRDPPLLVDRFATLRFASMAVRNQIVSYRCTPAEVDRLVAMMVNNTDVWKCGGVFAINASLDVPPASRLVRPVPSPGHWTTADARLMQALKSAFGGETKELGTATVVWEVRTQ